MRVGLTPYKESDWKKTNADRIRAMTDEELAELLYKVWRHEGDFYKKCVDGWLVPFYTWLKEEAADEK